MRTLEKYYDFADFSQSIVRNSDVGFARVKLFSNNFIIPVQIDKFTHQYIIKNEFVQDFLQKCEGEYK